MTSVIKNILSKTSVIPVLVITKIEDAIPLANALVNGGLNVLEITLRTPVALEAIKQIKQSLPDAFIGSGTVIDEKTLLDSMQVGVDFMVSPGATDVLLAAAKRNNAPLLPGVSTPSEVMRLLDNGYDAMKFFPAESAGGVSMLKSFGGPLPQVTFCPTGGINLNNALDYLALDNVACVGGTWMLDKQLIVQKNWDAIAKLASHASKLGKAS